MHKNIRPGRRQGRGGEDFWGSAKLPYLPDCGHIICTLFVRHYYLRYVSNFQRSSHAMSPLGARPHSPTSRIMAAPVCAYILWWSIMFLSMCTFSIYVRLCVRVCAMVSPAVLSTSSRQIDN